MIQKHRIATNIGRDQKVTVEIKQDFDIMEILSLKFSQKDIYPSGKCSEYGVVVGRVSANNGFGIPNAKVSIFIPQSDSDVNDPVISALYPYAQVSDKDENGYRYNLLPQRQQHSGHAPTGTFPDQQDILTREEVLQVFESYYSYTVKTNTAGDFMIWGVPIGIKTIHIDIDLSDIGCFSLRPYDFIKKGVGVDNFERFYKFKSSADIDGLPQIVSFDRSIEVYPLWGNEDVCEIGITRTDFDLADKGIKIEPISLILMSSITDDNNDAVKRNGKIKKNTGYKCNLQTTSGKIECVRQTGRKVYGSDGVTLYPELEYYNITEVIDENGVTMAVLPMNMEYVYTNIFGEEEITNDKNKGIPTTTIARFRIGLDYDSPKISVAKYLVPNIREFNPSEDGINNKYEYYEGMVASYTFSDNFEDYISPSHPDGITLISTSYDSSVKNHKKELMLGTNNNNIPEDYFYKFIYGKVYTVSSFQGTHSETERRDAFLGIKQIRPTTDEDCASSANYFPTNFGYKNRTKFSLALAQVILFVQYIFAIILIKFAEIFGAFLWTIGQALYNIGIGRWRPFRRISQRFQDAAYRVQDRYTKILPLTIYPDCEECTSDEETVIVDSSYANDYCRVAEFKVKVADNFGQRTVLLYGIESDFHNTTSDVSFLAIPGDVNNIFEGETAKDGDELCSGVTSPTFAQLTTDVNTSVIPPDPPDLNTSRYFAEIYSWFDSTQEFALSGTSVFSNFITFFSPTPDLSNRQFTTNGPNVLLTYTWEEWDELTGMNYEEIVSNPYHDIALYAIIRIYDRLGKKTLPVDQSNLILETGCDKYDKTYNEDIVFGYLWSSGSTYIPATLPMNPTGLPEEAGNESSYSDAPGFREYKKTTILPPSPYGANLAATIIGYRTTKRLPYKIAWTKIPTSTYDRKTKSGLTEFRDGVFTIIPVISGKSYSLKALQEWYRRKRIGLSFCGGVINYSFIDNWLNGILYFFKFDKRLRWDNESEYDLNQRGSKFPRELVFYHVLDKMFYYRSCPYYINGFTGQTHDGLREILHPTTFYDVGVRDEFLGEICVDSRIDPYCSVIRDITATSYQDPANVVEYAINYRLDINNGKFDVDDFFSKTENNSLIQIFDGDITQLMSINCEAGIEAFDLDTPHYFMYNGEMMDPETITYHEYFKGGGLTFGPTQIDIKFDNNGAFIRGCLNSRLGDYTQRVPFYLWDKKYTGFGPYNDYSDQQEWDKTAIASLPLQRLFSISGSTDNFTNYNMADGEEEYLLKPMTIDHNIFWFYTLDAEDALERFEVISYSAPYTYYGGAIGYIEGDLWLHVIGGSIKDPQAGYLYVVVDQTWTLQPGQYFDGAYETFVPQTILNYRGNKQVLSTPFLFYFGLKPGKTAMDLLIKYFGPKGAFLSSESIVCPNPDATPIPSATPGLPFVSVPVPSSSNPWQSPTPTPTPTASPAMGPPYFSLAPKSLYWEWDNVGVGYAQEVEFNIANLLYWYIGENAPTPSGVMFHFYETKSIDDLPMGRMPVEAGPDWLEMEVYIAGTWEPIQLHTPYSSQLRRVRFYPNSQNTTGASKPATIYFSDGFTNFTDNDNQYITIQQDKYTEVPPITYQWINSTAYEINVIGQTFYNGSLAFSCSWENPYTGGIPQGADVPFGIYRMIGGVPQILKMGIINNVKPGQSYSMNDDVYGILNYAPSNGDLIYIELGYAV